MLFLADVGVLTDDTRASSAGAGDERILFWLANRVGEIVATDTYGEGEFSGAEAKVSMAIDPRAHAPFPVPRGAADRCAHGRAGTADSRTTASTS